MQGHRLQISDNDVVRSFAEICKFLEVEAVIDVGANTGQFARELRGNGFRKRIVSFEPLTAAHQKLSTAASEDPLWTVAPRTAVGESEGVAEINIAGNSFSSSLLRMLDLHTEAAPESAYGSRETCSIITLDAAIDQEVSDDKRAIAIKIDTQGYELHVLAGLQKHRDRILAVLCEMSISPLYESAPTAGDVCHRMSDLGFRCLELAPGFAHGSTGELLQMDGLFVKHHDWGRAREQQHCPKAPSASESEIARLRDVLSAVREEKLQLAHAYSKASASAEKAKASAESAAVHLRSQSVGWRIEQNVRAVLPASFLRSLKAVIRAGYWIVTPWKTRQRIAFLREQKFKR